MHIGFFRAGLVMMMVGMSAPPLARAEIYTWIDASGVTNVSNLPPPDGAKVTKVQHAPPPEIVAREDAARDAARRAETQALAERVRQLEADAASPARFAPPPDYVPVAPPVIQYIIQAPSPPMQQTVEVSPPQSGYGYGGCDPSWAGCALSWFPGFFPFVVVQPPLHPMRPGHGAPKMTTPRLPPPFGPPLIPNFGPSLPRSIVMQQPMRTSAPSLGLKRG
ncbi:MAG TPA: DUF4124 domain-containing protein [Casimicrobiaceae bacterium]|nr:DUF4124 domain-containing protein [Casimicrobiaceae bacterium]